MKDFHDGDPPPPESPKIPLPRSEEPLLEPGTYELEYVDYRTAMFMGFSPGVEIRFRVIDSRYPAKPIVKRHYNKPRLKEQGEEWFSIRPEKQAKVTSVSFSERQA